MTALLAFAVYYNMVNVTKSWVASGKVDVWVAMAGLHIPVMLLAIGLLWMRQENLRWQDLFGRRVQRVAA